MTIPFESLTVFFAIFWKSGVALGAALGISFLLRKRSADQRRLVLSTTVVAMLLAAAALPVVPRWTAVAPAWLQAARPVAAVVISPALASTSTEDAPDLVAPDSAPAPPTARPRRIDPGPWLIPLIWFAGAATLLARFVIALYGLRRLRTASTAVTDADLRADVARRRRRVGLWQSQTIAAPVTWGILRPVILVPGGFEDLPVECRDAALCHELAHIQAYDFLMRCLAEIARALLWFQPLMWIVWRQLREEQELVCDNRVLAAGGKSSAYARLLMDWECRPGVDSLIAVGIAHRSCLKRRLYALLDPELRRDTVARAGVLGTWVVGLAAALPLAAISFTAAAPIPPPQPPVVAVAPPPVQIAQAQPPRVPVKAPATQPAPVPAPAPTPKFDAASIKPCASGDISARGGGRGGGGINWSPGRLRAECQTVDQLIREAYLRYADGKPWPMPMGGVRDSPISPRLLAAPIKGSPAWAGSDRYTVVAEAEGSPDEAVTRGPMLQALLEDRFQLTLHSESREIPVYALTVASGGPKLKPAQQGSCISWGKRNPSAPRPAPDERTASNMPCGLFIPSQRNDGVDVNGATIAHLCRNFSAVLDRDVVDKTGIEGLFDIYLDIPREPRPAEDVAGAGPSPGRPDPERTLAAAKIALVKLGLRLEPAKGAGKFLVIDRVERPSEN